MGVMGVMCGGDGSDVCGLYEYWSIAMYAPGDGLTSEKM